MERSSRASLRPQYALRTLSSTSARAPAWRPVVTTTPASAAFTPAEIFPKSHSGWTSFRSVRE
jgi:hypothetical protein